MKKSIRRRLLGISLALGLAVTGIGLADATIVPAPTAQAVDLQAASHSYWHDCPGTAKGQQAVIHNGVVAGHYRHAIAATMTPYTGSAYPPMYGPYQAGTANSMRSTWLPYMSYDTVRYVWYYGMDPTTGQPYWNWSVNVVCVY